MIASIINTSGATVLLGADTFTIRNDHPNYKLIIAELNKATKDPVALRALLDIPTAISTFTSGKVEVKDGKLMFNGGEVKTGLATRILALIAEGNAGLAQPLIKFLENLMANPSRRAVQGLYDWLAKSNLPITDDGKIVAYKIVGPNFMDLYSGKFDNSPGKVVRVERNEVDEDPNRTCSHGLHFCSSGYLPHYGTSERNKVVLVAIDPADVVAFPNDYNTSKGRCCAYTVLNEINREAAPTMFDGASGVMNTSVIVSPVVGMFVGNRGNVVLARKDGTEFTTRVPALGDYDISNVTATSVKLVPSNRTIRF